MLCWPKTTISCADLATLVVLGKISTEIPWFDPSLDGWGGRSSATLLPGLGPQKRKTPPQTTGKNANPLGRSCSVFSFSWVYSNLLLLLYQHWSTNESDADIWGSGTGWEGHFHRSGTQLGIQVPWCWFVGCSLKKLCMDKSIIHSWISILLVPSGPPFSFRKLTKGSDAKASLNHLPRQTLGAFSFTRLHRNRYCNISVLYVKFVNWLWCIAVICTHTSLEWSRDCSHESTRFCCHPNGFQAFSPWPLRSSTPAPVQLLRREAQRTTLIANQLRFWYTIHNQYGANGKFVRDHDMYIYIYITKNWRRPANLVCFLRNRLHHPVDCDLAQSLMV